MKTVKNILYWIIQCTWGGIMTIIGLVTLLVTMIVTKSKPQKFGNNIFMIIPGDWGGISLGPVFFRGGSRSQWDPYYDHNVMTHESGHAIQNLIFGPLFPLVIGLPSLWRAYIRTFSEDKMRAMTTLLTLSILILSTLTMIVSTSSGLVGVTIIGLLVMGYTILFGGFFLWVEIPKYQNVERPDYDEVWFEGTATKLGLKYYTEDSRKYKENKLKTF